VLPAPRMRLEMLLRGDPGFTRWSYDVLCSLRPQIEQLNLKALGDFETLIPGIGPITATAIIAAIGSGGAFRKVESSQPGSGWSRESIPPEGSKNRSGSANVGTRT
jgi:hypothetical protein